MALVKLKQSPDSAAQNVGLNRYNRSVFPGTIQGFQPHLSRSGRWRTGLDEYDPILRRQAASEEEYKILQDRIRTERESLEKLTGLDLGATSKYWDTYLIMFSNELTLDLDVPADKIMYRVLVANNFAAPNPDIKDAPEYVNAKFYLSRTEEEESTKAKNKREKNRAFAALTNIEENKDRLLSVGKYIFGNQISDSISMDSLYNLLSDLINDDKKGEDTRRFLSTIELSNEDIQLKLTLDEAIAKKIIRLTSGLYQRGNITYGKSLQEMITYFSDIENSGEFASILEEVREKRLRG